MKYKFKLMTNYPNELKCEINNFNFLHNTDLEFIKILEEEVTFVEIETSISNELLFNFGVQLGRIEVKLNIENKI